MIRQTVTKGILLILALLSLDTMRAQDYWQQTLRYDIDVELDDSLDMLYGECKIQYINNSPDTLSFVLMHLYPNAYSTDSSYYARQAVHNKKSQFYFSPKEDKGYIDSLFFTVDGRECLYSEYLQNPDVIYLDLPQKLLPGDSIVIQTPFRVKIPKKFSRMGRVDKTYSISQWYPKPAVYDKNGWHPIPYADIGEFYGEFAEYDVSITLPADYIVASCGVIQDSAHYELIEQHKYVPSTEVLEVREEPRYASTKSKTTVHSIQQNIHDFAWSASRDYLTIRDTVSARDRVVDIFLYARPEKMNRFTSALDAVKNTISDLSLRIGAYPYSQVHLVYDDPYDASVGGMEYPTYTLIQTVAEGLLYETVSHEVAHNWFYGILANNERKEPFMDESFTSFLHKDLNTKYNENANTYSNKIAETLENGAMHAFLGRSKYYNVNLPSEDYTEFYYGLWVYGFGTQYLKYLQKYLGDAAFDEILATYYDTYKWKHHSYDDFIQHLNLKADKSTQWFDVAIKKSNRPLDFALRSGGYKKKTKQLKIKNLSDYAAPVSVQVTSDSSYTFWVPPFVGDTTITIASKGKLKNIDLNADNVIPENNVHNNKLKKGFRLVPLTAFNTYKHKREVYFLPTIGYNYYDGFMAGLGLHNYNGVYKKLNYWFNPMYGVRSKDLVGNFGINKNWVTYNSKNLKSIDLSLVGRSFHSFESNKTLNGGLLSRRYLKVKPELQLHLDNQAMDDYVTKTFTMGFYYIQQEAFSSQIRPSDSLRYLIKDWADPDYFGRIAFEYQNKRLFNPYNYKFTAHLHEQFVKLLAEASIKINYNYKSKGLKIRGFGGWIYSEDRLPNAYYLQASNDGETDYLFDQTYLGRNRTEGLYANQFFVREGGFKSTTPQLNTRVGTAKNWMLAINTTIELPIKIPLNFYIDVATRDGTSQPSDRNSDILYNAGLSFENYFAGVYFPLFYSKEYKDYFQFNAGGKWYNRLSFRLNLPLEKLWHIEKLL